jgi:hypothetical protein
MRKIIFLITILISLPTFAESDCQKRFADLEEKSQKLGMLDGRLDKLNSLIIDGMIAKKYEKVAVDNRQYLMELKSEYFEQNADADSISREKFIEECLK